MNNRITKTCCLIVATVAFANITLNAISLKLQKILKHDENPIGCIAWHPERKLLLSGDYVQDQECGTSLKLWNIATGDCLSTKECLIQSFAWHPDGKEYVLGTKSSKVEIYDFETDTVTKTINSDETHPFGNAFNLMFEQDSGWINFFTEKCSKLLYAVDCHSKKIYPLEFPKTASRAIWHPNKWVMTIGYKSEIDLFSPDKEKWGTLSYNDPERDEWKTSHINFEINSFTCNAQGNILAIAFKHQIRVNYYDDDLNKTTGNSRLYNILPANLSEELTTIVVDPTNNFVISGTTKGRCLIIKLNPGQTEKNYLEIKLHESKITHLEMHKTLPLLASADDQGNIKIWKVREVEE